MSNYLKGVGNEFKRIKWIKGKGMVKAIFTVLIVSGILSAIVLGLDYLFNIIT